MSQKREDLEREVGRHGLLGAASAPLLAVTLALTGCTLGPEPELPKTVVDETATYLGGSGPETVGERSGAGEVWWVRIGDPDLVDLVGQALRENSDLAVAAARVMEAEAQLRRVGGSRWPQVTAGVGASRVKNSFVLPGVGRTEIYSTNYSSDLSIAYLVDIFGKLERSRQAAWASLLASRSARQALEHAIISGVVRGRIAVANLEHAVDISDEIRTSWTRTLQTVERRYQGGLSGAVDLYLARENLSAAKAVDVQLRGDLDRARHAIDVLVGRRPGSGRPGAETFPELPDRQPVLLGVPADLLDQRPDVRQAEMELAAATYGVGVALADLFPSLTVSASAGSVADTLGDLTSSEGLVYSAVAGLVAPVFNGGQRRADVEVARARVEQAAASYAGTVLNALREVEDALVSESAEWQRLEHTQRRVEEARAADRLARQRYQRGVENLLKVLETERRLRAAEEALISTRAALWNARVDLHLALGGVWRAEDGPGQEEVVPGGGRAAFGYEDRPRGGQEGSEVSL